METKKKYDSLVIYLYSTGREKILPWKFRQSIPYTTIANWRRVNYSAYIGSEYRELFEEAFRNAEMQQEYTSIKRGMNSLMRSWYMLREVLLPVLKKAGSDKAFQKRVLGAISYIQSHTGLERALKLLGISPTLFRQWTLEARFDCIDSWTALCTKRHPHQLEVSEIQKIKKMLSDPEYDHWPIVSIASKGIRSGDLVASLCSWYKYARIFGITKKPFKKDRKTIGLVAKHPNEYLHVDTTYFSLVNGQEIYITFVMDNYSKMVLGFHVSDKLSFELVKEAIKEALKVIVKHTDQKMKRKKRVHLVADGGKENHHHKVNEFLSRLSGRKIKKIIALKDIRFSNSPVEAIHRTMKGRYLRRKKFITVEEVVRFLDWAVMDYNVLRPHYKHRPLTPSENTVA